MNKKLIIFNIVVTIVVSVSVYCFAVSPFIGDPISKLVYRIRMMDYLEQKYDYSPVIEEVYYDMKAHYYCARVYMKEYPEIGFQVFPPSRNNKDFYDMLCENALSMQLKSELKMKAVEIFGECEIANVHFEGHFEDFSTIPNYDIALQRTQELVIYVSIPYAYDKNHETVKINQVFALLQYCRKYNPFIFECVFHATEAEMEQPSNFDEFTNFYILWEEDISKISTPQNLLKYKSPK